GRDREGAGPVGACAAEVRGLVERGEVRAQARDEGVEVSAGRALGAADGAREVRRLRLPRNVYLARREFHPGEKFCAAASEIRGLVGGGEVGAESRHEVISGAAYDPLGASGRAREVL